MPDLFLSRGNPIIGEGLRFFSGELTGARRLRGDS